MNPYVIKTATKIGLISLSNPIDVQEQALVDKFKHAYILTQTVILYNAWGVTPFIEERFLRELIQNNLLKKGLARILDKIHLPKEKMIDTKIATTARILITSSLIPTAYLMESTTRDLAKIKAISAFFQGVVFGMISESNLGIVGSRGAHFINSLLSYSPYFANTEELLP